MTARNFKGQVRISAGEKELMRNAGLGFSRVFRMGLDTLKLSIQRNTSPSCVYLYNTGRNHAPPAAASCSSSEPPAQVCPCLACPIRAAFGTVPHVKNDRKENVPARDLELDDRAQLDSLYDHERSQDQQEEHDAIQIGD